MIIQGSSTALSTYSAAKNPVSTRQTSTTPAANLADKVTISEAARALLSTPPAASDSAIENRLNTIKAKPAVERSTADTDFLLANDQRMGEIRSKDSSRWTADELDYMQKAGGFVNTMANLSTQEKALYDELVAAGNTEALNGMALIALSRQGMQGQQVTLPDGKRFDPTTTDVTADNIRMLFKHMFVDTDGSSERSFEALANYLERRAPPVA